MTRRDQGPRERRAAERARQRRDKGDPRPYMVILREERSRLGLVIPLVVSRRSVNIFGPGGTL